MRKCEWVLGVPNFVPSYLVLDYYAGGDLYKFISSHGPLRPSVAADLFRQLIDGLCKRLEAY